MSAKIAEATLDLKNHKKFTLLAITLTSIEGAHETDSLGTLNFKDHQGVDRAVSAKDDNFAHLRGYRELVTGHGNQFLVLRYHPQTGDMRVHRNDLNLDYVTIQITRENLNRGAPRMVS